ncbi:MAG: cyclic nucleotide-binding domain-containing protein [Acidimicrobiia bacterium]
MTAGDLQAGIGTTSLGSYRPGTADIDAETLKNLPIFSSLSRRELRTVAQHADEVVLPAGSEIVSAGALAYEMFIIVEGAADVLVDSVKINQLGSGDVVGEIGVLKTHKRTATVVATTPIKAVVMYGPELKALEESVPEVFTQLKSLIRERLG